MQTRDSLVGRSVLVRFGLDLKDVLSTKAPYMGVEVVGMILTLHKISIPSFDNLRVNFSPTIALRESPRKRRDKGVWGAFYGRTNCLLGVVLAAFLIGPPLPAGAIGLSQKSQHAIERSDNASDEGCLAQGLQARGKLTFALSRRTQELI